MVPHGLILTDIINLSLVHCSSLPLPRQLPLPRRRPYIRVLSELLSPPITLYTPANLPQLLRRLAPPLADTKNSLTSRDCLPKSVRSVSSRDCHLLLTNKRIVSVRNLMFGFGDDRNPSSDTVNVMEEILVEYIADVVSVFGVIVVSFQNDELPSVKLPSHRQRSPAYQ